MHIAAFKGAIFNLAKAYQWANDDAHTAKDVAAVWQEIFDNLEECTPTTTYRQLESCILEASNDGGVTWDIIFDASSCVREGIVDAIQDGTISGGSQPPGDGAGNGGQCYTYQITLRGSDRWISPIAIDAGDVITVSSVQGAWWSGELLELWSCGDGGEYTLGTCTGNPQGTNAGNPSPTLDHMRLVGNLALETTPYFDLYNTSYTVINGPQDLIIQANDDPIDDNDGSLTFTVEICKGLWCVEYDFTANDQNWFNAAHNGEGGCLGSYHAATGWVSDCQPGGTFQRISIGYGLDLTDSIVTALEVDVNSATGSSTHSLYIRAFGVDVYNSGGAGVLPSGNSTNVFSGLTLTNDDIQWITYDTPAGEPITIKRVRLRGSGPRPPGEPSC